MKKAFTLIELLVTIVLFSLLLATSLYSFRFISLNIRNINNTNPQEAIYYSLLRKSINSIYYYVVEDEKETIDKRFYHYFKGTESECFFISKSAFYSEKISMVHLKYEDGLLIYEEGEIFKEQVNYLDLENIPLDKKKIVLKSLKKASFSYLNNNVKRSELLRKIPERIEIIIEDREGVKSYVFQIKADNYNHLSSVKFGKESL